jgi:hypothetical protein
MSDEKVMPKERSKKQEIGRTNNEKAGEGGEHAPEVGRIKNDLPGEKTRKPEVGRVHNQNPREVEHEQEIGRTRNEKQD